MSVILVHPLSGEETAVSAASLSEKCTLFKDRLVSPYEVKSSISIEVLRDFVSTLEGKNVAITTANFAGLSLLCEEFGFSGLSARLSAFAGDPEDGEARRRIAVLEERALGWDRDTAALQAEVARLSAAVESLRAVVGGGALSAPASRSAPSLPAGVVEELRAQIWGMKAQLAGFASLIVADFPEIFAEFRGKRFSLLWRGSRDGFGARDFHRRCDRHANTLTLIRDTKGNIFGGFTPVEWESREWNGKYGTEDNCHKADPSLKSFIFTLKNPHNFPARKFALKAEKKDHAIYCYSSRGPFFWDIAVSDNCNANTDSYTGEFGYAYTNDTGLDAYTFFTGSFNFKASEIEVFEIAD